MLRQLHPHTKVKLRTLDPDLPKYPFNNVKIGAFRCCTYSSSPPSASHFSPESAEVTSERERDR